MEIVSINEIINMHRGHFFSKSALVFFKSRLPEVGYRKDDIIYFITSEKSPVQFQRLYSIRVMDTKGNINTLGEFQGYKTLKQAKSAMASLLSVGVKEL
jgi:hypothetical protein